MLHIGNVTFSSLAVQSIVKAIIVYFLLAPLQFLFACDVAPVTNELK